MTAVGSGEATYGCAASEIRQSLSTSRRVLAMSHANPDADAICSLLAFERAFRATGVTITLAIGPGEIPTSLEFLGDLDRIGRLSQFNAADFDVLVYLDCADQKRVNDSRQDFSATIPDGASIVNIDHHVTNEQFGTVNVIDPAAAATCEILALLLEDCGIEMEPDLATILLTGIQGDTLGLRTPSTTSRTLSVSSNLLAAGANLDMIVDQLFRLRPFTTLKLWGKAFSRAELAEGLVWTEITPEMLAESGATAAEAEGIVNFLAGTMTARVAALLYRERNGWRISLRSLAGDIDVAALASNYGGGGHSRAAGLRLDGDLPERDAFLRELTEQIRPVAVSPPTE